MPDPTPEQIAERCAEIQRGWSAEMRLRRLRADLRPMVRCADSRLVDMAAGDYGGHIETHEALARCDG
jgi:hypothetical protein